MVTDATTGTVTFHGGAGGRCGVLGLGRGVLGDGDDVRRLGGRGRRLTSSFAASAAGNLVANPRSRHVRAASAQAGGRPGRIVLRERVGSFGTVVTQTAASLTLSTTFKRVSVAAVAVSTGSQPVRGVLYAGTASGPTTASRPPAR